MRGESTADHQEMTQQQEENVEGEGDKDEEEMFSGITSFPLPFLHLAVLRISFSQRLEGEMPVCGNTTIIPWMTYKHY